MLEARRLSKSFAKRPAVVEVSFTVRPGDITGYLGPNGAGKTTTIRMLAGLLEPDGGSVLLDGREIREDPVEYRRRIGYVPEQSEIYLHLSAFEYLELVGRLRGITEKILAEKIPGLLSAFGLGSEMHDLLGSYSKGMRQKVLLAGALLHDPRVLLLDEPMTGLDVTAVLVLKDLLRKLAERGRMIIFSSHILEVVERLCRQVVIIQKGRIVAADTVESLQHLRQASSLEDIFGSLVATDDADALSSRIIELMTYGPGL